MCTQTVTEERYNVQCRACNHVWSPMKGSGLWLMAKRRDSIETPYVGPKTCGCEPEVIKPDAPYRVFGYDMTCEDYDIPCDTFIKAVKLFKKYHAHGDMVFISGISERVRRKIEYGC